MTDQTIYFDDDDLTPEELLALRNRRAGIFAFQVSWIMAFVAMAVVNWQLRFSPNWKPEGTQEVSGLVGLIATLILIGSTVLMRRALAALEAEQEGAFRGQWAIANTLGLVFVLIMLFEWLTIQTGTQYSQVFRLMTGFHMFHALVIGAYNLWVYVAARRGVFNTRDTWAVEAGVRLWTFVLVAWMLFYVVIYWV